MLQLIMMLQLIQGQARGRLPPVLRLRELRGPLQPRVQDADDLQDLVPGVCVYIYIYIYVCVYICIYTHTYVYTYIYIYVYMHKQYCEIPIYIYMYTHTQPGAPGQEGGPDRKVQPADAAHLRRGDRGVVRP